mgnify:CR=1 FL=1
MTDGPIMGVLRPLDPQTVEYPDSVFDYPSSGTSSTMDEEFDEVCISENSKFDFLLLEKSVFVVRKRQKS